jgi:hypothetical protein
MLTFIHVLLSLIGIASGVVAVYGLVVGKRFDLWTAVFLSTTIATSMTGFFFPVDRFLPSHAVGILSLVALAIAVLARYTFHLAGAWRRTYVICAVISLYFNVFVLIVQSFLKVPALHALAPTQSEPPFFIAHSATLVLFVVVGVAAARGFRNEPAHA